MEFVRGGNGLLGFVINEAGVVQRVDGKAKSSGLTAHSRMLQVIHTPTQPCSTIDSETGGVGGWGGKAPGALKPMDGV